MPAVHLALDPLRGRARGSMLYSAVTHPRPLFRRNEGTRSSTVAAQSTFVPPISIRAEPSAFFR